jgi:NitT/TauT family transport system permease protein/putative hydroxymethylpyrimidine transport system permease protein
MAALALLVALVGAWQLGVELSGIDRILLPAPNDVATSLWQDRGLLWANIGPTGEEIVLGLALALAVAMTVAIAVHMIPPLRAAVMPLIAASQAVPVVLMAPLLVAWFGFDVLPKAIIVAVVTFFPIAVTTLDGLRSVDPALRKLLRTFGASRWHTLRLVEAPAALPGALSGAKIAVAVAVIGAVLAEDAGTSSGLGLVITQAINQLDTARAFAATLVLTALAAGLFGALALAERRLVPWAARARNRGGSPT